jgi:hypothetical protein
MSAQKEDLSKYRQEIDKIDDKIISLLKDRMEIVKEVGKHRFFLQRIWVIYFTAIIILLLIIFFIIAF